LLPTSLISCNKRISIHLTTPNLELHTPTSSQQPTRLLHLSMVPGCGRCHPQDPSAYRPREPSPPGSDHNSRKSARAGSETPYQWHWERRGSLEPRSRIPVGMPYPVTSSAAAAREIRRPCSTPRPCPRFGMPAP